MSRGIFGSGKRAIKPRPVVAPKYAAFTACDYRSQPYDVLAPLFAAFLSAVGLVALMTALGRFGVMAGRGYFVPVARGPGAIGSTGALGELGPGGAFDEAEVELAAFDVDASH